MAWNCESWLILAVWGMVVASWNHHGTNISPCSDSLINNNFYPAPVRTFVNLDKTDITRGIELNDHWRILMNFTVFSYLFVAHGRVVNFPSFPLIHAGISDLKVTYRHIITISCTKQWHGKYTWYWGDDTVSGRDTCLTWLTAGITCLSIWGLLAPLDRAVELVPASLKHDIYYQLTF